MTQLSKTTSTCETQWKMLLLQVFTLTYLMSVCAAQDGTATSSLDETTDVPPTTYNPPKPSVTSPLLDVYINEKVVLTCGISSSSGWTFTWTKDGNQLSPNADFSFQNQNSELTITANRKDLSGRYSCKGEDQRSRKSQPSKPAEVKVKEPPAPFLIWQTDWADVFVGEAVSFRCEPNLPAEWKIIWYRNSQTLNKEGPSLNIESVTDNDKGAYACQATLKSRPFSSGFSNTTNLNVNSNDPKLTLSRSPGFDRFYPEESIRFTCNVDVTSAWKYQWHKDGTKITDTNSNTYEITSLNPSDKGQYLCKVQRGKGPLYESNKESVQVADNKPKPVLTRSPAFSPMYPGESINFACDVDMYSGWEYEWHHKGVKLQSPSSKTITIRSVTLDGAGDYQCFAKRGQLRTDQSDPVSLQVSDPPKPILKLLSPWSDVFQNEVLKFSCGVSSSEWTVTWHRNHTLIPNENELVLNIAAAKVSDRGEYSCKAHHKQRGVSSAFSNTSTVSIYDSLPIPTLSRYLGFSPMYIGETVKLECTVSVSSGWSYHWYKDGKNLNKPGIELSINLTLSDDGRYSCEAKRGEKTSTGRSNEIQLVVREIPVPLLSKKTPWLDVFPSESVQLSCRMEGSSGWTFIWYKDSEEYREGTVTNSEAESILSISQASSSHRGNYRCSGRLMGRTVSSAHSSPVELTVYDKLPTPTLSRDPIFTPMFRGETVKLKCPVKLSSGWSYHWYKDAKNLNKSGEELSITLTPSDKGGYSCEARRGEKTSTGHSNEIQLDVRDKLPTPTLSRDPIFTPMFRGETVKLKCPVKLSSGWSYHWYKDAKNLNKSGEELSITLTPSDKGGYSCEARRGEKTSTGHSNEIQLDVRDGKPNVTLLQNPSDEVMHTGDTISFTCHVNVSSGWKYVWYKDRKSLKSSEYIHEIDSASTSDSGSYKCQVERETTTKFSSESLDVQLKIDERPKASIVLLTSWSEVFSTDSLKLQCDVMGSSDLVQTWNYIWYKEGINVSQSPSPNYKVTPSNDPEQSSYTCEGISNKRPLFSARSDSYRTKNLLLKRRILLSISGCLFFGIIAVFIGCVALRICRKPVAADDKQEEANLFLTMAELKDRNDAPCPLVEYITDADVNPPAKEGEENGTSCSEETPLPITSPDEQAATTNGKETTENGGGMVSFLQ